MSRNLGLSSPYDGILWDESIPAKAQFHTHTNRRRNQDEHNGAADAHQVIDFYAERDFDVLVLGDHEGAVESVTWPWMNLSGLVSTWEDRYPIGTHAEAPASATTVDMVAVKGIELGRGHDPEDMVCLFHDMATSPSDDNVEVLEAIEERGGVAWAAHVGRYGTANDWSERWWRSAFNRVPACLGMEVYNKGYDVEGAVAIWDAALCEFLPERQIWAFAGDDLHSTDSSLYPQAWQTLYVEELTRSSVRLALEKGQSMAHLVYESEGAPRPPTINAIDVDGQQARVTISATNCQSLMWISNGSVVGTNSSIKIEPEHVPYVRAVLRNEEGETITQPITVTVSDED